jgi:hypothetical protein
MTGYRSLANNRKKSIRIIYVKIFLFLALLCLILINISCATKPVERESPLAVEGLPPVSESVPERPRVPPIPENILGKGLVLPVNLAAFLMNSNPEIEKQFIEDLAVIYKEEAAIEGVNHDVAFAQMCLETGYLRFGGLVTPDMNNFCGLGAIGNGQNGEIFPDPRTGVRAHIQHLKAYASEEPLKQELVDPRYRWVRYGSSPAIKGLSGTWAADKNYADKINSILERIYKYVFIL